MNITGTHMTVADYCQAMERGELVVNRDYQRSDLVWPPTARSYLIETILLGYPLPKMYLHQLTDPKSRKTTKYIVDGQQRSKAIYDFFKDQLRLLPSLETEDIQGRTYSQLSEEYQHRFVDFPLSLDLFLGATTEQVVEVFRRMNTYTVPLNHEEQRHASFQGPFKWFVNRLTQRFYKSFLEIGLFTEKQLVRMADAKLVTEVCDALTHGIRTTSKTMLDKLYREFDVEFPAEAELEKRITAAFDDLRKWRDLSRTALMKPYVAYALVLATTHLSRPVSALQPIFNPRGFRRQSDSTILANLSALAEAVESDTKSRLHDFVEACTSKTNVKNQRIRRFQWMCKALTSPSL